MLLILFAILMKFVDISRLPNRRCPGGKACNNNQKNSKIICWEHIAGGNGVGKSYISNSSSTSSGCDSNASSKENFYTEATLSPQQVQQMRHQEMVQQQQLQLLQLQLLQRRHLQQQLREQGIMIGGNRSSNAAALTCNQQYLMQQRLQQQQQQRQYLQQRDIDNDNFNNNNNPTAANGCGSGGRLLKGQKFRRGMTEFSTNNDINNKSHLSQPLQNSPRHLQSNFQNQQNQQNSHQQHHHHHQQQSQQEHNSPQHIRNFNNHLIHTLKQTLNNELINPQSHPINNSSTNFSTISSNFTSQQEPQQQQQQQQQSPSSINSTPIIGNSTTASATQSPQHYKNPLNSPNNSAFAFTYYGNGTDHHQRQTSTRSCRQLSTTGSHPQRPQSTTQQHQQQLQQQQQQQQQQYLEHLRNNSKFSTITPTQYQRHLNDLLLQEQQLQNQQQEILNGKDGDDELSEESLKQNVAIVLNNLNRYNNALRSIILNEEVSETSCGGGVFLDDSFLLAGGNSINNNNFLHTNNTNCPKEDTIPTKMATAITPESDYNSNATTPAAGGVVVRGSNVLQVDRNLQLQSQQLVGFLGTAASNNAGVNNVGGVGGIISNNIGGGNVGNVGNGSNAGYCTIGNNLNCSLASSHDFTHDNSDYQWFVDYGYRDGCTGMQRSVLSSLSASCNNDFIYYEDMAKNLDANLAEADMESFRTEDIHSLLSQLPSYCKSLGGNSKLQQSLMMQQHLLPVMENMGAGQHHHHHILSQISTTSTNELIDNSICKSQLLFSPVKESHISVDSLDMDGYPDDGDIILTCKANKDNYTIAFEGSILYSDDSFYEPNEVIIKNKQNFMNLHCNLEDNIKQKSLEASMSQSDQAFLPRESLQKSGDSVHLQRYPSGNNNTSEAVPPICHAAHCTLRKSNSLPNLEAQLQSTSISQHCQDDVQYGSQEAEAEDEELIEIHQLGQAPSSYKQHQLNVSQAVNNNSAVDCSNKVRNLLPMCQLPISCSSNSISTSDRLTLTPQLPPLTVRSKHRCSCSHSPSSGNGVDNIASVTSQNSNGSQKSGSSGNSNTPAFNLVKLFIKQKSSNCSSENQVSANTCMDVSSGCWPSSEAAGSSSSSSLDQRLRKKSMNDSGKGSALSRHDEEELCIREDDHQESVFKYNQQVTSGEHSIPKKHSRAIATRTDGPLYYDEDPSSSSAGSFTTGTGTGNGIGIGSPLTSHRRRSMPLRNPQLCQLALQHGQAGVSSSAGSIQSSEPSRSQSDQLTQVYVSSGTIGSGITLDRNKSTRTISNASSSEMITRSMQTSCGSLSTRSSFSDRFRCVPPSFLEKLNSLGEERQAPIYVIYPSYALPDLGFVKTNTATDVIFSPFNYKAAVSGASSSGSTSSIKKRLSTTENEVLKSIKYTHVVDWKSLTTLLPPEYRRRLKHIPEVNSVLRELDDEVCQRPLFCMTPPIRRNRSNICDCAQYFQENTQLQTTNVTGEEGGSQSSGSSQPPSSGYRGSSTLLTDSELDNTDPLKQLYVYQHEQQRLDSGVGMSPAVGTTPPQPLPRGILRKSSSNALNRRTNRNSMIEDQQTKLSKLEKRRSLQEPPYRLGIGSSEELDDVYEEDADLYAIPQPRKERLSRKELDARTRAENFLSSLPRSELKHYAEIAAILESSGEHHVEYDPAALKKEVSRALSQQKKVSFHDINEELAKETMEEGQRFLSADARRQRFSTPPNSPNISMGNGGAATVGGLRQNSGRSRHCPPTDQEIKDQRKLESNRFKRLQIQWELMSKDSNMLKDLVNAQQQTKSGGSTPTAAHKSRIPRPVSYPAGKRAQSQSPLTAKKFETKLSVPKTIARMPAQDGHGGKLSTRSPSRIIPPKRYSATTTPSSVSRRTSPATTPTNGGFGIGGGTYRARTPNRTTSTPMTTTAALTAPSTPKRTVQSARTTTSRVR